MDWYALGWWLVLAAVLAAVWGLLGLAAYGVYRLA